MGFSGPVGLKGFKIIADSEVLLIDDACSGANEEDAHLLHIEYGRDFKADIVDSLRLAVQGDPCPACGDGSLVMTRGIEVGHIFQLGVKYSERMKAVFLDEDGKERPCIMGCYGIGVGRTAAAAIEQKNDKDGIIWPASIAPYQVAIVPVDITDQVQRDWATEIYEKLSAAGADVLFDDRDGRVGVRLKDIDLFGIPIKVIIGPKALAQGKVEFKLRANAEARFIDKSEVLSEVSRVVQHGGVS